MNYKLVDLLDLYSLNNAFVDNKLRPDLSDHLAIDANILIGCLYKNLRNSVREGKTNYGLKLRREIGKRRASFYFTNLKEIRIPEGALDYYKAFLNRSNFRMVIDDNIDLKYLWGNFPELLKKVRTSINSIVGPRPVSFNDFIYTVFSGVENADIITNDGGIRRIAYLSCIRCPYFGDEPTSSNFPPYYSDWSELNQKPEKK